MEENLVTPKRTTVPLGRLLVALKWKGTPLGDLLQKQITVTYMQQMDVADFKLHLKAIMYLSEGDLVLGNEYRRALVKLRKASNVQGIVLVETTNFVGHYFQNVQKFAVLELGLTVVPVKSIAEAAQFLSELVNFECRSPRNPFKKAKLVTPHKQLMIAFIRTIPKVGDVKAKLLIDKFNSLQNLCNASVSELSDVLGPAVAKEVKAFLVSKKN